MMKVISICIVMMVCWLSAVNAQLYKWVDENGVTHYSNKRPSSMKDIEVRPEVKSDQSYNRNSDKLDQLLNSYQNDSEQQNTIPLKKKPNVSKRISLEKIEYYELRIKQRQRIADNYSNDLRDLKRTPHKDYRSHKKRLRYFENLLERAQLELKEAQNDYDNYIHGQ